MGKKISLEEEIKKTQELLASLRKKQAEQQVELSTVALGEIVKIAGWDFIVVNQNTWENETSLLSKDLLLDTNLNLNDIADISGFANLPYFCRQFKKRTGYAPAEYRKIHRAI